MKIKLLLGICAVSIHSKRQSKSPSPLPSLINGFSNRKGFIPVIPAETPVPVFKFKTGAPKKQNDNGQFFTPEDLPPSQHAGSPVDRTDHAFQSFHIGNSLRGTSNKPISSYGEYDYDEDEAEINDFDYINEISNEEICGRPAYTHNDDLMDLANGRTKRGLMSDAIADGKRIVGGQNAKAHSWPWTILLTVCIDYGWAKECFKCGGVLIGKKWALTAGHCLPPNKDLDIIAEIGKHKSPLDVNIPVPGRRVAIKSYKVHEGFRKIFQDGVSVIEHDLALIEFVEEVEYSNHVRSSCLPDKNVCIKPGTTCVVVGWGYMDEQGQHGFPTELQEAPVKIFDNEHCRKFPAYGVVDDNMICAGWINGGVDACGGDSGGPLTCKVGNQPEDPWVLAGTVSWGIGCARANSPGVYTNIAAYSGWITKHTGVKPAIAHTGKCIDASAEEEDFDPVEAELSAAAESGTCYEEFTVPNGKRYTFGAIKSPGYPHRYKSGESCRYCMKGDKIMLKFREFKMNLGLSRRSRFSNSECDDELDIIKVFDKNNKLQHQMCLWKHSRVLIRAADEICLEWSSAQNAQAAGGVFVFGYKIENNSILKVDDNLNDEKNQDQLICPHLGGIKANTAIPNRITSPNFPNTYPDGLRCSWTVEPEVPGFDIEVTLKKAITRWTRRCKEERLEAFWGKTCQEVDDMESNKEKLPRNRKHYVMTCGRARKSVLNRFSRKTNVACVRFMTFDPRIERSSGRNRHFNTRNGQTSGWYIEVQANEP